MNAHSQPEASRHTHSATRRWTRPALLAAPLLLLAAGTATYLWNGDRETTDNAYVQRAIVPISSRVAGQVVRIDVQENQTVTAGQILFRLDPKPFTIAVDEAEADLAQARSTGAAASPAVRRARARLEAAKLSLDYAVIRAPQDGVVTKVDQLQVGSYVSAAHPIFLLAGTRMWIEANFKESQLRRMRVGQPAHFEVDAFPELKLHGRVASLSPGTGSRFSALPPENATGNWVKVVQRLPVRFTLEGLPRGQLLPAGLSVEATVETASSADPHTADTPPATR